MTEEDEKALFGTTFERLGQYRRVRILKAYGMIESDVADDFDTIRRTRNQYLHLWSHEHSRLPEDAVDCFHAAIRLAIEAIGQDFKDGRVVLKPALVKYLEQKGMFDRK